MTSFPSDSPDRLDRIEAILATVATQQLANTQVIAQLGDKIDRLAQRQEQFQVQLEESVGELIRTIDYAVDRTEELVRRFLEQSSNGHD